jgi:hypothetical protein
VEQCDYDAAIVPVSVFKKQVVWQALLSLVAAAKPRTVRPGKMPALQFTFPPQ